MVFSIFKSKSTQKMPERQVARPKAAPVPAAASATPAEEKTSAVPLPDLEFTATAMPATDRPSPAAPPAKAPEAPAKPLVPVEDDGLDFTISEFEKDFSASNIMAINVEHDLDPVQADIEQAAVLFANGQDSAARAMLEASARAHEGLAAERLWRMLLDLMQVLGDRAAFDKLGEEFAQVCETSPPTWREQSAKPLVAVKNGGLGINLQGVLTDTDVPELAQLRAALAKKQAVRLDISKLVSCDNDASGVLAELLLLARRQNVELTLVGADGLAARLASRLTVGNAECERPWLLLLELYQYLGQQEVFEEKAVDYAVTFEMSPPSWEASKAKPAVKVEPAAPQEAAYRLEGEIKNCRFDDLSAFLELHDQPVLDCSRLKRLDFFSAGLLRNVMDPFKRQGKEIIIRHPHHLVAELMGIVGLTSVARIIVIKI